MHTTVNCCIKVQSLGGVSVFVVDSEAWPTAQQQHTISPGFRTMIRMCFDLPPHQKKETNNWEKL